MKRLAIIFGIMCFGAFLMLTEKDKKETGEKDLKKMKKKLRKSSFPVKV
ncbi:MAG: hypothetical protein M3Z26_11230 [Bacteroidota bacterium]|nr:hypothetical protein [Bacteroidota bacterium]